ncbi:hypothetical protein [Chitinimonas sp.]|uniref:hypothetical protein n=1 Tax=Chitinimonas sp. TaxID=1934313 RepID=UPI0035B05A54
MALLIGVLIWASLLQAAPLQIRHAPGQSSADQRYAYYWGLLQAALEANRARYGDYILQEQAAPMTAARATAEVERSGLINIIVRTADRELERKLRPIRIPLDKGLTGYRLFLINEDNQPQLDKVSNLAELARFEQGQDRSWVDVKILRAAGLPVVEGEGYDGLFQMLRAGRFTLFSRGVNEIASEFSAQQGAFPKLAIERQLMLYYPLPRYFYVARDSQGEALAARIEDGLQRLRRSGEFDRRYLEYKKRALGSLQLSGRRLFRIANPTLPTDTPMGAEWWDDLKAELK